MEHSSHIAELSARLRDAAQNSVNTIRLDRHRDAATELRNLLDRPEPELEALAALTWHHWLRHASTRLDEESGEDGAIALQSAVPCFFFADDIARLPSALLSLLVETIQDPIEIMESWGVPVEEMGTGDRLHLWFRMLVPTPLLSPNLPRRLMTVCHLSADLLIETGDLAVFDELDQRLEAMISVLPETHPNRDWVLLADSNSAMARYSRTGSSDDREAAVARLRRAEEATGEEVRSQLRIQRAMFEMEQWDLDDPPQRARAERLFRDLLDNAAPSPAVHAHLLSVLGRLVAARFEQGDRPALDESIGLLKEALRTAPSAEQRQQMAQLLGLVLGWRLLQRGDPADADRISALARELRPDLFVEGGALRRRFGATIDATRREDGSVHPPDLFESHSDTRRAGQALSESMGVLDLIALFHSGPEVEMPPLEQRATYLYFEAFDHLEDPRALRSDIAEADRIEREAEAQGRVPWRLRVLPLMLRNYAGTEAEDPELLADFVERTRRVLTDLAIPEMHRVSLFEAIAQADLIRCRVESRRRGAHGIRADTMRSAMQSIEDLTRACGTDAVSPSQRIHLAQSAARLAHTAGRPEAAADVLTASVMLLPQVVSRHARPERRRKHLTRFSGITGTAVAFTLARPGAEADGHALQLLEVGRNVLHNQIIASRAGSSELRRAAPRLADRYERLMGEIDEDDAAERPGLEPERRHRAAEGLKRVIAEIRALDGFESFGGAPPVEELLAEAAEGPIAALSISGVGSHALIVRSDGIERVELRYATAEATAAKANAYLAAIRELYTGTELLRQRRAQRTIESVLTWVHECVTFPVLGRLGFGPSAPDDCPRMWWAPGGLLGLLPLHAAGDYRLKDPILTADRVVSSYTPTIRQLRHARRGRSDAVPMRGFAVAMPTTPGEGYADLPYVEAEVTALSDAFPGVFGAGALLTAEGATREAVVERLRGSTVAHFACHATTDPADPAVGGIVLADHAERPLTVEGLAALDLDHADLVFLSACSTARSTEGLLIDEALHLAGACQVGGFRHVIGTLWQVEDDLAARFAADFYRRLGTAEGDLDPGRSALAAHLAMHELRAEAPSHPHRWSAWIHYGA